MGVKCIMGERYWISGVQLGMLKAFSQMNDPDKDQDMDNIIDKVIEEQFIGNTKDTSWKLDLNDPSSTKGVIDNE